MNTESSPFQSPSFESTTPAVGPNEKVYLVARYQRRLNLLFLVWIVFYVANLVFFNPFIQAVSDAARSGNVPVYLPLVFVIADLAIFVAFSIGAIVIVVQVSHQLQGTGGTIVVALLMFVPCISLLVMLALNGRATKFLKDAGVSVGFLGATEDSVRKQLERRAASNSG